MTQRVHCAFGLLRLLRLDSISFNIGTPVSMRGPCLLHIVYNARPWNDVAESVREVLELYQEGYSPTTRDVCLQWRASNRQSSKFMHGVVIVVLLPLQMSRRDGQESDTSLNEAPVNLFNILLVFRILHFMLCR